MLQNTVTVSNRISAQKSEDEKEKFRNAGQMGSAAVASLYGNAHADKTEQIKPEDWPGRNGQLVPHSRGWETLRE
jgi:hypothetical protein